MMIQAAPNGKPRFVNSMREHNALCSGSVRALGNENFKSCEPCDEMIYVVSHHDYGWDQVDASPILNSANGFPCGLGNRPVPGIIETGPLSVAVNVRRHLYCGLISSMHTWGLYNERYGFSQFEVRMAVRKSIPVDDVEKSKRCWQTKSPAKLKSKSFWRRTHRPLSGSKSPIFCKNYKQLQFFDTLALYFHLRHEMVATLKCLFMCQKTKSTDASITLDP